jgi:Amt family ammonium transporter
VPFVAAFALVLCIPALAVLHPPLVSAGRGWNGPLPRVVAGGLSTLVWLGASAVVPAAAESSLRWPIAALAAIAGCLVGTAASAVSRRPVAVYAFCAAWSALVFVPAAVLVFFPGVFGFGVTSSVWDLGGAVPVHVAGGVAVLALLRMRSSRRARAVAPFGADALVGSSTDGIGYVRSRTVLIAAGIVLWSGWVVALVGLDMAIDSITPLIVRNGIIVPSASILGWVLFDRIRHHRTRATGVAGGLIAGLVAITPAGGSLGATWAVALGIVVGLASASSGAGRAPRHLVATHLLAGAIGLLWVGLFGDGGGFIYTGQFSAVQVQLAVTVVVAGWSYVAAVALSPMLGQRHPPA